MRFAIRRTMNTGNLVAVAVSAVCGAEPLRIPADDPAIQARVGAAVCCNKCMATTGTYQVTIDFFEKAITVRNCDDKNVTTFDDRRCARREPYSGV